jgi:excisionase family DNA binding protein
MTYFKLSELPYLLNVCDQTVSRWIKAGKLEYVELSPRRRLVSEEALLQFIEARTFRQHPAKRVDRRPVLIKDSKKRSLKTEYRSGGVMAEDDVKSLRKEIASLWR